ncbi:exported protein of unknown function [Streptomyces sp. KY75]|nr:exported protein of unknown function [Streptomyces sp. KY70]CAD5983830.1 exported protein of unknown function [Streptomyces sp. KY75]
MGFTATVCVHLAWSWPAGVAFSADVPLRTGVETVAPLPAEQDQLASPDSKPAFLALLTSAAWAVETRPVTVRAPAAMTAMAPPRNGREVFLLRLLLPAERCTWASGGELVVRGGGGAAVRACRTDGCTAAGMGKAVRVERKRSSPLADKLVQTNQVVKTSGSERGFRRGRRLLAREVRRSAREVLGEASRAGISLPDGTPAPVPRYPHG